jgi:hypothetical protein
VLIFYIYNFVALVWSVGNNFVILNKVSVHLKKMISGTVLILSVVTLGLGYLIMWKNKWKNSPPGKNKK